MDTTRTWRECDKCGKTLASYKTMWQHKKTCKYNGSKDVMQFETARNDATGAVEERSDQRQKDSQWSSLIDSIINKKPIVEIISEDSDLLRIEFTSAYMIM